MKLIIERERWLRGSNQSALRRSSDGRMCCLGFFGLACGYESADISEEAEPADMVNAHAPRPSLWPEWIAHVDEGRLGLTDTKACADLIETNDSSGITEAEREQKIAAIFGEHGVEVEFR